MSEPDRGAGEYEHESDCECPWCMQDRLMERADQINDERIDMSLDDGDIEELRKEWEGRRK